MLNNLFSKKNHAQEKEPVQNKVESWMENDSHQEKMALDVYQTDREIVVKSALAGVRSEDLKISLHNDLLNIKGIRRAEDLIPEADYLYQECYFGEFSRSIILPHEVDGQKIEASLEDGILTIKLPKIKNHDGQIKIKA